MGFRHRISLFFFSLFPQILLVALCNSRAMGEAGENSDIDLFIIAKKGNLWTVRFIVTALTSFLGIRRSNTHGLQKGTTEYIKRTKDRFCLSFFITEEAMNFESIRLQPNDPYLDRWIATLIPLVNKSGTFERFMEENSDNAPLSRGGVTNSLRVTKVEVQVEGVVVDQGVSNQIQTPQLNSEYFPPLTGGHYDHYFFSFFEGFIKRIWLKKTLRTYERLGKPWGVVISDTMLKFHDQDVRREYADSQL